MPKLQKICSILAIDVDSDTYYLRTTLGGRTYNRTTRVKKTTKKGTSEEREARKRALEMISKIDPTKVITGRPKFKVVAEKLLEVQSQKAQATYDNSKSYINNHLIPFFGHKVLENIKPADWDFYQDLEKNRGYNLEPHRIFLNMIMNYAFKNEWISKKIIFEPAHKKYKSVTGKVFSQREVKLLLQAAKPEIALAILFGYCMGMRRVEMISLERSWFDLEAGTVDIRVSKNENGIRKVKMHNEVWKSVREHLEAHDSKFLFPSPINSRKPISSNKTAWFSTRKNAGVEGRFHDLRHSFLTNAAKKVKSGKESVVKVCKYAGVTIPIFEKHYLHLDFNDTSEIAGLIELE